MSQLLHMILFREAVIPRSIQPHVDTADGDGYQALYNLICRHHPNTSVSNMVQTSCPRQGPNDYFALHVSNVQLYVAAENSRGRQYTDKEEVAMVMATLHPKFKDALMAKVRVYLTTTEALPYELHLTTMAPTLEEWAKELALPYHPVMPSLSPPALSPKPVHLTLCRRPTRPFGFPLGSSRVSSPRGSSGTIHFPDHILQPLAEEQVLRVMQDPKGARCEACHLAGHTAEDCHALINHAVAHYMLVHDKALRERILAKHKQIVRPRRRASLPSPVPRRFTIYLTPLRRSMTDADVADAAHDDAIQSLSLGCSSLMAMTHLRSFPCCWLATPLTTRFDPLPSMWSPRLIWIFMTLLFPPQLQHFAIRPVPLHVWFIFLHSLTLVPSFILRRPPLTIRRRPSDVHLVHQDSVCYQIDSGSAATTVSASQAVTNYQAYPRIGVLRSPRLPLIASNLLGLVQPRFLRRMAPHEHFRSKVTPGLPHDILSPGQHLDENRDKYWGFMLLVDARDSSSRLIFKKNDSRPPDPPSQSHLLPAFSVTTSDMVIDGVYRNRFQYTRPVPFALLQERDINSSLNLRVDTNPSEDQLGLSYHG